MNMFISEVSSILSSYFQDRFLDEVLGSGFIVYLSPVWVSCVYQQVININLLEEAGFGENNADLPLVHLLTGNFIPQMVGIIQNCMHF